MYKSEGILQSLVIYFYTKVPAMLLISIDYCCPTGIAASTLELGCDWFQGQNYCNAQPHMKEILAALLKIVL